MSEELHSCQIYEEMNDLLESCKFDNWDGYGAKSINLSSYYMACEFIKALPIVISTPEIAADPDGEVSFEWYSSPCKLFSVSISGSGSLSYAGLFNKDKIQGVAYFKENKIPQVIMDNIQKIGDFSE